MDLTIFFGSSEGPSVECEGSSNDKSAIELDYCDMSKCHL